LGVLNDIVVEKLDIVIFYHDSKENNSQSYAFQGTEVRKTLAVVL
jgi:hypothetical protein